MESEFHQILHNQKVIMECVKYFVTYCVEYPDRLLIKLEEAQQDTQRLFDYYTKQYFDELAKEREMEEQK